MSHDFPPIPFNRADPARSLMLAKPVQEVAHGGGLRFERDSRYYKIIFDWISQGVPYGDESKDRVTKVSVTPENVFMKAPGEGASDSSRGENSPSRVRTRSEAAVSWPASSSAWSRVMGPRRR